jgi:thiamine-phosphate pyrophosphorylase
MTAVLRILDANANRAREALRVLEDAARFLLDDDELAGRLKTLRDGLRAAMDDLPMDGTMRIAWRDTPGDVGAGLTSAGESSRPDVRSVVVAAGKRLGEALRTIEEYAKTIDASGAVARRVESLRYAGYDAERTLVLSIPGGRFGAGSAWRLCVLLTESLCAQPWETVLRAALRGGADCIQVREKDTDGGEFLDRVRAVIDIVRSEARSRAAVIVNDRVDVALLAGADGVHVGQDDLCVGDVRKLAGRSLLVGVSTADVGQARVAVGAGADYCGVGPMFRTTTKDKPALAGPAYLRAYLDACGARAPCLAIGGVDADTVGELVGAAAGSPHAHRWGAAVSSAVCGADDPEAVCRAMAEAVGRVRARVNGDVASEGVGAEGGDGP